MPSEIDDLDWNQIIGLICGAINAGFARFLQQINLLETAIENLTYSIENK